MPIIWIKLQIPNKSWEQWNKNGAVYKDLYNTIDNFFDRWKIPFFKDIHFEPFIKLKKVK